MLSCLADIFFSAPPRSACPGPPRCAASPPVTSRHVTSQTLTQTSKKSVDDGSEHVGRERSFGGGSLSLPLSLCLPLSLFLSLSLRRLRPFSWLKKNVIPNYFVYQ